MRLAAPVKIRYIVVGNTERNCHDALAFDDAGHMPMSLTCRTVTGSDYH